MNWISVKDKLPEFNQKIIVALSVFCPHKKEVLTYSYDIGIYCCKEEWDLQFWTSDKRKQYGYIMDVQYWDYLTKI